MRAVYMYAFQLFQSWFIIEIRAVQYELTSSRFYCKPASGMKYDDGSRLAHCTKILHLKARSLTSNYANNMIHWPTYRHGLQDEYPTLQFWNRICRHEPSTAVVMALSR
mgnify:CR=1 FL=1